VWTQSSLSRQYIPVQVRAPVDPRGDSVQFAFLTTGEPANTDWATAVWDSAPVAAGGAYTARCLVGPGGTVTLAAGVYTLWVKITDSPEVPVMAAGKVQVL
jgi:hypothetical protein